MRFLFCSRFFFMFLIVGYQMANQNLGICSFFSFLDSQPTNWQTSNETVFSDGVYLVTFFFVVSDDSQYLDHEIPEFMKRKNLNAILDKCLNRHELIISAVCEILFERKNCFFLSSSMCWRNETLFISRFRSFQCHIMI